MGKSPKPPPPIDANAVASQANAQNAQNAFTNQGFANYDQYGPFGSTTYALQGVDANGVPRFAQTTSLSPGLQAQANQGQGAYGGAIGGLGSLAANGPQATLNRNLYDPEGLIAAGVNQFGNLGPANLSSNDAFDRAYGYATANLEPRFDRARDALENKLRNQGLDPTSEAYKSAANDLALQQNEARNSLVTGLQGQMFNQGLAERQNAVGEAAQLYGLGTGRAGQVFGQDQAIAALGGQNYGQQLGAYQALGGLGMQGLQSAASIGTGAPSYNTVGQQNVDIAGLMNQQQQQAFQNYKEKQAAHNAKIGAIAGIAGTALGAAFGPAGMMATSALGGLGSQVFNQPGSAMNGGWSTTAYKPGMFG